MDKILYIIIASAVIIAAGAFFLLISMSSTGSVMDFTDSTKDVKCESQADQWESGNRIDERCIEHLPEDKQDEALATAVEDEIT